MQQSSPGQRPTGIPAGVQITGEVVAAEDIDIHGQVEGQITAPDHQVTVGATGAVTAKIIARAVTLAGHFDGTITASERVRIIEAARVSGHLHTPSLTLADGATFNGTADPERTEAAVHVARYRQKQQE
jgi:cytoskeletal protein CcmA (bactofilin family)